jgi:hypothetical protein
MTQKNSSKIISVVHPICCGLDVHKDMVSACIIITDPDGEEKFVVQEFSTFTDDLFRLKSWLLNHDCNIVAMETINHLESKIEAITRRLDDSMLPHQDMIDRLDQIPGID